MTLQRRHLEEGLYRHWDGPKPALVEILTEEALAASRREVFRHRRGRGDMWLFGYGSLIWNPLVHFVDRRVARVHGYHRRFCHWSTIGRGSPDRPGLVLSLDFGGSCTGVAFRIANAAIENEMCLLWRREMVIGSYCPRWVRARIGSRTVEALAFVANHAHPNYSGPLAEERLVETLAHAAGRWGSSLDYLRQTVEGLAGSGIDDHHLRRLLARIGTRR